MSPFFKKTKYNSKGGRCSAGHYHPSRLERNYCEQLKILEMAGEIRSFEYAKRYALVVNDKTIGFHKPDFTVVNKQGMVEVHETKGMETSDWHLRKNLFEAIYPEIPYIVIK